ncbi:MAG: hypothetical protein ACE366_12915 [Bradymonadia bacterium]
MNRWGNLLLACGLLVGCGGAPEKKEVLTPPEGELTLVPRLWAEGGYVTGCVVGGDQVWLARRHEVERWAFPAGGDPQLVHRWAGPSLDSGTPIESVGCSGDRLTLSLHGGDAMGLSSEGVAWKGPQIRDGWPLPPPKAHAPSGSRWRGALANGRQVIAGEWGWGVQSGAQGFEAWRFAPGDLRDAAVRGREVWTVGASGLWHWRPGQGRPVLVVLPAYIPSRNLQRVFFDDAWLWIVDDKGTGWPLDVSGAEVRVSPTAGGRKVLPPTINMPMAPVNGGRLEVTSDGLVMTQGPKKTRTVLPIPGELIQPIPEIWQSSTRGAVLTEGSAVAVAAERKLSVFRVRKGGLVPMSTANLPGGAKRLFVLAPDALMAVSPKVGVVIYEVKSSSSDPRSGHQGSAPEAAPQQDSAPPPPAPASP